MLKGKPDVKILKKVISIVILIAMVMTMFTGCAKVKAIVTDVGDTTKSFLTMLGDKAGALWQTISVKVFKTDPEDVEPIDVTKDPMAEWTTQEEKTSKDVLTVALNATFTPYEFYVGDEIRGADVEIAELIGDKLGREIVLKDVSFDRLFRTLEEGKADLIISAVTEENYKGSKLYFTDSYSKDTQAVIIKKRLSDTDRKIESLSDIEKGNVGVFAASSAVYYAEDFFDSAKIQEYASYSELFNALVNGAVNGVVVCSKVAKEYVNSIPEIRYYTKNLESARYVIAAKDRSLRDEVNGILKKLMSEGEIEKIITKYEYFDDIGAETVDEKDSDPEMTEEETVQTTVPDLPVFVTNENGELIGTLPAETTEKAGDETTEKAEEKTTAKTEKESSSKKENE